MNKKKDILFCFFVFLNVIYAQPIRPCEWYGMYNCNSLEGGNIFISNIGSGILQSFYWPNDGSLRALLPTQNLKIGAFVNNEIRFSYSNSHHFSPGPVQYLYINDSISNPKYRTYKIQKDFDLLPESEFKDLLRKDYDEWPIVMGAPVDSNSKPLFLGDQTVWMINNDTLSSERSATSSNPLFAEILSTIWTYRQDPILKNVIFYRHQIINRDTLKWFNTFVGDVISFGLHVGGYSTFAGTDSAIQLGYFYHSSPSTTSQYGNQVPSVGFVLLQGPLINETGSKGFKSGMTVTDKRNQPVSSMVRFLYYPTNSPPLLTPPANYSEEYNALKGLWKDGTPIRDPFSNEILRFAVPGDPVTGKGWTDISENLKPYYRYSQLNVGPFDLAPGESQEVVGAIIVGQGRDHLQSVNVLKHHARYVKSAYPFLFGAGLPSHTFNASSLGGKIFLTWDTNAEKELPPLSTYKFQGYYVYQGETANGPWHKIATFDKSDDVTLMMDEVYSSQHLTLTDIVVDELPNKGLRQFLAVDRDTITQSSFINGRPYHFAVEPFWYDTESRPKFKAGKKVAATVVPQQQVPGSVYDEPFAVVPHSRKYDDAVQIHIIDPTKLKGKDYSVNVTLSLPDSAIRWTLKEEPNTVLLTEQTDTSGLFANPVVDGFTVTVRKPPVGLRRDFQNPRGWQYLPEENRFLSGAAQQLIMDGFNQGIVYPTKQNYESRGTTVRHDFIKQVMIRFGQTQKAYRYATKVRAFPFSDPPRDSSFIPFIKNRGGGFVYQDFVDVPFTVWEVDSLDGDLTPRQLNVAFLESNDSLYSWEGKYLGRGDLNGRWKPTIASNGGDERIYIFASDYSETPNAFYTSKNLLLNGDSLDTYYVIAAKADTSLRKDKKDSFTDGDVFILTPNYPLVNNRTFTFSTSAPTIANAQLAKQQGAMDMISVFPNPYMGGHALESSVSSRFVTISGLPATSIIRIFNLSGRLIRTIYHNTVTTSLQQWDLRNDEGIKVASGLYLIHIESPGIGTKVLKLMVLYPDERLNAY